MSTREAFETTNQHQQLAIAMEIDMEDGIPFNVQQVDAATDNRSDLCLPVDGNIPPHTSSSTLAPSSGEFPVRFPLAQNVDIDNVPSTSGQNDGATGSELASSSQQYNNPTASGSIVDEQHVREDALQVAHR